MSGWSQTGSLSEPPLLGGVSSGETSPLRSKPPANRWRKLARMSFPTVMERVSLSTAQEYNCGQEHRRISVTGWGLKAAPFQGRSGNSNSQDYYLAVAPCALTSMATSGMDRASVKVRGGGIVPLRRKPATKSMASGAVGGLKTVAVSKPRRSHSCPV